MGVHSVVFLYLYLYLYVHICVVAVYEDVCGERAEKKPHLLKLLVLLHTTKMGVALLEPCSRSRLSGDC